MLITVITTKIVRPLVVISLIGACFYQRAKSVRISGTNFKEICNVATKNLGSNRNSVNQSILQYTQRYVLLITHIFDNNHMTSGMVDHLDSYLSWQVVRVVNVTSVRHHHIETGMDPKMKSSPTLLPLSSAPLQDCGIHDRDYIFYFCQICTLRVQF